MVILCHEHRYVFIKTRKTAGTSVEIALAEHTGPNDVLTQLGSSKDNEDRQRRGADAQNQAIPVRRYGAAEWRKLVVKRQRSAFRSHMPARDVRRFVGRRTWDGYFTFAIARNPWETAVSAYAWQKKYRGVEVPFGKFIEGSTGLWHNWPLYTVDDDVIVDEVIRYDELASSLASIVSRLGLPRLDIPRAKSGLRKDPYQASYTEADRALVADVCRKEIEHFGWTFD